MDRIYADHASTTRISEHALQVMTACMRDFYGNPSSVHICGREAAAKLKQAREKIAACICAEPSEIYFTSGGTEADNQAILTGAAYGKQRGKHHMIFSQAEHHAVLNCIPALEREGFEITLLQPDESGCVTVKDVEEAIREDTCMVAVMSVNNEVGTIAPLEDIGRICREKEVLFFSDAVAAAGHIEVNVKKQGISMLSISGHKFGGPRGIGALYVNSEVPVANLMYGGSQEKGRRPGTQNVPGIVAMSVALSESVANLEENTQKLENLRQHLLQGLSDLEGMWVNGSKTSRFPGITNLGFEGVSGEALMLLLDLRGICVSTGAACNTESVEPSHVLVAMGLDADRARSCIRISLSADNTKEEVDAIIAAIKAALEKLW